MEHRSRLTRWWRHMVCVVERRTVGCRLLRNPYYQLVYIKVWKSTWISCIIFHIIQRWSVTRFRLHWVVILTDGWATDFVAVGRDILHRIYIHIYIYIYIYIYKKLIGLREQKKIKKRGIRRKSLIKFISSFYIGNSSTISCLEWIFS